MDLAAWWQARRWVGLLELIDNLPDASRLKGAIYNDPEQARLIAIQRETADPDRESWSPSVAEYDLHAMLLREVVHNLAALRQEKNPTYIPAPRTEIDRQAQQLAKAVAVEIGARFGFSPEDF